MLDIAAFCENCDVLREVIRSGGKSDNCAQTLIYVSDTVADLFRRYNLVTKEFLNFRSQSLKLMRELTPNPLPEYTGQLIEQYYENLPDGIKENFKTAVERVKTHKQWAWNPQIIPKESTRVKLDNDPNFYFNANYVQEGRVIVSSAPKKEEIEDFWKLILGKKVDFIINVTDIGFPEGCDDAIPYWPEEEDEVTFGNIVIRLDSISFETTYTLREFAVFDKSTPEDILHVTSRQYPIRDGCFMENEDLFPLYDVVKDRKKPFLLHCLAGSGRSGTIACSFEAMRQISLGQKPDPITVVNQLREERIGLVNNPRQLYSIKLACHQYRTNL